MSSAFAMNGRVGIVTGLANHDSLAYGCAQRLAAAGAEMLVTYATPRAERFVLPLAAELGDPEMRPCDVQDEVQLDDLFQRARERWGRLDFLIHSVAFAPLDDLHGRVVDCSLDGFQQAMDISCHSFLRMAQRAEPLMRDGGTLICMTYRGAERVVDNYGMMGPVKAALESATRYAAAELGPRGIRVHALSAGPIPTRAASGLKDFDALARRSEQHAPLRRLVSVQDVGNAAVYLASPAGRATTGTIHYLDAGDHIRY